MALSTRITSMVEILSFSKAVTETVTAQVPATELRRQQSLANGTGANQADEMFSDTRTLGASSNEDLDLAGTLTNAFGDTITFARVKVIKVSAASGNGGNIVLGAAATNTFTGPFGAATHTISIPAGGEILLMAPDATAWAVTAGTGDLLRVANDDGLASGDYTITIIGATA